MKKGVLALCSGIAGLVVGGMAVEKSLKTTSKQTKEMEQKMISYYHILNTWLSLKQDGHSLQEYFIKNGYGKIAIYGMKELGERLYDELKDSDIIVECIIDKNAESIYFDMEIIQPDDDIPEVDVIVVTASFYYDEIEETLSDKVNCPIVSIEDVVYEI